MLFWVAVRPLGTAGEGFRGIVIPGFPEVDIGTAAVVFAAGPADAVFLHAAHEGLLVLHVLCHAVHAGTGTSFRSMVVW